MTNTSIDIEQLLQQAEFQQQQLALKLQFEKNITYFKTAAPELVEAFLHYQPTQYVLQYQNGYWDLVCNANNKFIYGQDPREFSEQATSGFFRKPYCYRINLMTSQGFGTENDPHVGNINPMLVAIDAAKLQYPEPRKSPIGKDCPMLIVNGIGLGHHIDAIIKKSCIHHLTIVEPEPDIIFASLHTIDWGYICEEFSKPGRSLNLVLAQSPQEGSAQIISHIGTIGLFNCTRTYVFTHLKNQALQQTIDRFLTSLTTKVAGLGYFDDERIGFAHTVQNFRLGKPLLDLRKRFPASLPEVPVFVVANGPSLDQAKEMLEKNQHKAIIISCGTALGSLYQMGIKPDIHVEMERTRPQLEWVDHSTDAEYRKDILLLTLNTTHPDMFHYFDEAAMALKTNDIGSLYLVERLNKIAYNAHLDRCNPTVGNTGLAFACALGFKKVYIAGLDLGFPDSGQHHSKYSVHYRVKEEELKNLDMEIKGSDTDVVLPGNFGGDVTVTIIFRSALNNAKNLVKENSHVEFYNTSEGVLIEGAIPTRFADVAIENSDFSKREYVNSLLKHHSLPDLTKAIPDDKEILKQFSEVTLTLNSLAKIMKRTPTTKSEVWEILQTAHEEVLKLKTKSQYGSLYLLIKGSVDAYLLVLSSTLYVYTDDENIMAIYQRLLTHLESFISEATYALQHELFTPDKKVQELDNKLHKL